MCSDRRAELRANRPAQRRGNQKGRVVLAHLPCLCEKFTSMGKPSLYSVVAVLICASVRGAATVDHSVFRQDSPRECPPGSRRLCGIKRTGCRNLGNYLDLLAMVDVGKLPRKRAAGVLHQPLHATMIKANIDRYHPGYRRRRGLRRVQEAIVRLKTGRSRLNDRRTNNPPTFKEPPRSRGARVRRAARARRFSIARIRDDLIGCWMRT